jgi:hypothetical protein
MKQNDTKNLSEDFEYNSNFEKRRLKERLEERIVIVQAWYVSFQKMMEQKKYLKYDDSKNEAENLKDHDDLEESLRKEEKEQFEGDSANLDMFAAKFAFNYAGDSPNKKYEWEKKLTMSYKSFTKSKILKE